MLWRLIALLLASLLSGTPQVHANSAPLCVRQHLKNSSNSSGVGIAPSDAALLVRKIASSIGLVDGLTIVECDYVEKALAWSTPPGTKDIPSADFIIYRPDWAKEVLGKDPTHATVVFGHELGHLVGRHTTSRKDIGLKAKETEADGFAGCAVARMKMDWNRAAELLGRLRHDGATAQDDYPSLQESLAAARNGYDNCGGIPPKQTGNFLGYKGPPVTATHDDLVSRYPSGKWFTTKTPRDGKDPLWFRYETTIQKRAWRIDFLSNDTNGVKSKWNVDNVVYWTSENYSKNYSQTQTTENGSEDNTRIVCTTYKDKIADILSSTIGEIIDRPIVSNDDTPDKIKYLRNECNTGEWQCSKSYSTETTIILFDTPAIISLKSTAANWWRNENSPSYRQFSNLTGGSCGIAIDVRNPKALREIENR